MSGNDSNSLQPARPARRGSAAFSLIEIIIVVGLLSLITLGLFAMFGQTQRVFRAGLTQVDVLEGGRNLTDMIRRELEEMSANYLANEINQPNFNAWKPDSLPLSQELAGQPRRWRTNLLERLYFLTRENQTWTGIGYTVLDPDTGALATEIGTLYRYESSTNASRSSRGLFNNFINSPLNERHRVLEGVVHFKVRVYNPSGVWMTNAINTSDLVIQPSVYAPGEVGLYTFYNNTIPAYVELEFGILEDRTYRRVKSIPAGVARTKYLTEQTAGKVHLFRLRVPVRNVDPAPYQ